MASADVGHLAPSDHAEAIGQFVIAWSELEHAADELIMRLGVLDESYGSIVLGHIDFRDKLAILRSLGFVKQPNDEWFAFLEKTVNQIDGVLRPFRNRIVHDAWSFTPTGRAFRVEREPKLLRPQAHERVLDTLRAKPTTPEDIVKGVKWAMFALGALSLLLEMPLASREAYPWEVLNWT